MPFAQLFWGLSAAGAILFFCVGFLAATLKGQRARESDVTEISRLRALLASRDQHAASATPPATVAENASTTPPATVLDKPKKNSLPPATMDIGATKSFQSLLERLRETNGMRAAVLGDSMGFPVAAIGEQSESLAGCCGFISQAASKTRDFLALGRIRRIVIEDERVATVTACNVTGTDLFLATLTAGPGPDLPRMVQLLNDVKSFMSQRSPA